MKKIVAATIALVLLGGTLFAQNIKAVPEKDVTAKFVKDFHNQQKDASDVAWWQIDSLTFKVTFLDADKSRQAMILSNKGTETHFFIDKKYYPAAIRDTVSHLFPDFTIDDVWVRKVRNKMTYQAKIVKMGGFLWWRKVKATKLLNWEVDGKYIGE